MFAYKAFTKELKSCRGSRDFNEIFKIGEWYEEDRSEAGRCGFHAATNPLDCLNYYPFEESRFFRVEVDGDIHEDMNYDTRLAATRIKLLYEITPLELLTEAVIYILKHPKLDTKSVEEKGSFRIIISEDPVAQKIVKGEIIALIKKVGEEIPEINMFEAGDREHIVGKSYNVKNEEVEND